MIRELEAEVERRPDDIKLRMKLAHFYLEVDRIEVAIDQYRTTLEIDPAFDPAYRALEELKRKFPNMFREREEPHIDREIRIRTLEEKVERHPDDIELRIRLAHFYREVDRIEAAIVQYKAALEIDPDFDPALRGLKELGYKIPDVPREREEPLEDSVGEVISANEKEVKLKTLEGDVVSFRVPSRQKEDGSWVLNEDLSEMARSLDPGAQVKIQWRESEGPRSLDLGERVRIQWRESEGHRIIHRMERVKE